LVLQASQREDPSIRQNNFIQRVVDGLDNAFAYMLAQLTFKLFVPDTGVRSVEIIK
jgi:hypothetical protein